MKQWNDPEDDEIFHIDEQSSENNEIFYIDEQGEEWYIEWEDDNG